MEETNSWKEKIDPAFDELIKVYMDFIKNTCICTSDKKKRYLTLDDESLKVMERKRYPPLLKEFKPNSRNLKKLTDDMIAIGASPDIMHILDYCQHCPVRKLRKTGIRKIGGKNTVLREYFS